jgi:hypothetical protein
MTTAIEKIFIAQKFRMRCMPHCSSTQPVAAVLKTQSHQMGWMMEQHSTEDGMTSNHKEFGDL